MNTILVLLMSHVSILGGSKDGVPFLEMSSCDCRHGISAMSMSSPASWSIVCFD
jgi:hypothetical protein